jgi:SAM-dependent methyltransferase
MSTFSANVIKGHVSTLNGRIAARAKGLPGTRLLKRILKFGISSVRFYFEFRRFAELGKGSGRNTELRWNDRYPCLNDRTPKTEFDRHYVYHTAWAARVLAETLPSQHIDVSSTLYFSGIVSAFIPIEFYDYRPANLDLKGLTVKSANLLALPFENSSLRSISCMHVIEHIGLGRYDDQIDPDGDLKAIAELKRVLSPGGDLLIVVPIGRERIRFNAHRVYSLHQIESYCSDLKLREFALIPDNPQQGGLVRNATSGLADSQEYGCGCFWFTK